MTIVIIEIITELDIITFAITISVTNTPTIATIIAEK